MYSSGYTRHLIKIVQRMKQTKNEKKREKKKEKRLSNKEAMENVST